MFERSKGSQGQERLLILGRRIDSKSDSFMTDWAFAGLGMVLLRAISKKTLQRGAVGRLRGASSEDQAPVTPPGVGAFVASVIGLDKERFLSRKQPAAPVRIMVEQCYCDRLIVFN